jgi:hypothetical protein
MQPSSTPEAVTQEAVDAKMTELNIVGFSSLDTPTLDLQMACLKEVEGILAARRKAA